MLGELINEKPVCKTPKSASQVKETAGTRKATTNRGPDDYEGTEAIADESKQLLVKNSTETTDLEVHARVNEVLLKRQIATDNWSEDMLRYWAMWKVYGARLGDRDGEQDLDKTKGLRGDCRKQETSKTRGRRRREGRIKRTDRRDDEAMS